MKRIIGPMALIAVLAGCQRADSWSLTTVLSDAAGALLARFPESEAPEVVAARTPWLSSRWETSTTSVSPIPDSLLRVLERPGLPRLPLDGYEVQDSSKAILSFFEPRIRGDSVFVVADWLFPTGPGRFFGQEYELVYYCYRDHCVRVRFRHVGTLN